MTTRRAFLAVSASVASASAVSTPSAFGQTPATASVEAGSIDFPAGVRVPTVAEYLRTLERLTGSKTPYREEIETGKKLLADIPKSVRPIEVAARFDKWRKKEVGKSQQERDLYAYYAQEWAVRGNPVIMGFFDATGYRTPAGDVTHWCSAFVCWCIERSRIGTNDVGKVWPYKEGAASRSYRTWGQDVEKDLKTAPRAGDLAVFENKGDSSRGHVGFVVSYDGNEIMLLGGNQAAPNEFNGTEVNIKPYKRDSELLKFHSFRRHPALG